MLHISRKSWILRFAFFWDDPKQDYSDTDPCHVISRSIFSLLCFLFMGFMLLFLASVALLVLGYIAQKLNTGELYVIGITLTLCVFCIIGNMLTQKINKSSSRFAVLIRQLRAQYCKAR